MLQLPEFSLTKRAALCTSWNWGILAHLVLMKSMGVFSLLVMPESLWLILTAETHSALEITIQSAMFPKLAFTQAFGSGRRSNWSFLGSIVAKKFWGKQREAPVRDGWDITPSLLPKSESLVQTAWAALRWTQNLQSPGLGLWMLWGSLLHRKLCPLHPVKQHFQFVSETRPDCTFFTR